VVICLELGADLRMAQLMPLPLTVSCFSKIQIGFAFLVPAHPGSPGKRAVKRVCVRACVCELIIYETDKYCLVLPSALNKGCRLVECLRIKLIFLSSVVYYFLLVTCRMMGMG